MFRTFLSLIFVAAITFSAHIAAYSQTAPVNGTVFLEKDGAKTPIAGALIEVYRANSKGGFPSTKTDKRGDFRFAGMPFTSVFIFSVSAPGCEPSIFSDVKAGQEGMIITLSPGDGRKYTEAEARSIAATPKTPKTGTSEAPELTDAEKKEREEIDKKNAEIVASNKKIEDTNKLIKTLLAEGDTAFNAAIKAPSPDLAIASYDLAIAKYDGGYRADPDYEGSAPLFLTNKGLALTERAKATYRQALQGDAAAKKAARDKAKADFEQAIPAFEKALEILAKAPAGDANVQAGLARMKTKALESYVATQGVMAKIQIDSAMLANSIPILDKYVAAETDDTKKLPVLMAWSNNIREGGQTKTAIHGYRMVLEKAPDNLDALAGMGLSLFAEGVGIDDKAQMQEGLNLMQKFADTAPDTHPLKASVKESVEYLKSAAKLTPQKVPAGGKKK